MRHAETSFHLNPSPALSLFALDAVCGGATDEDGNVVPDPSTLDGDAHHIAPELAAEPEAPPQPEPDPLPNPEPPAPEPPAPPPTTDPEGVVAAPLVAEPVPPEPALAGDQVPLHAAPHLVDATRAETGHGTMGLGPTQQTSPTTTGSPTDLLRDLAQTDFDGGPPRLHQRADDNCAVVSTLNQIARTPEGQAHLASRITPLGDGFHQVRLTGADGSDQNVIVREPSADLGSAGDANLRLFEKAIAVHRGVDLGGLTEQDVYANFKNGAWPSRAMTELGLGNQWGDRPENYKPADAIRIYNQTGGALGGSVMTLNTLRVNDRPETGDEIRAANALRDRLSSYGLIDSHAYEIATTYRDPQTQENMVLLRNPHGRLSGQAIPERELEQMFSTFSYGRLR